MRAILISLVMLLTAQAHAVWYARPVNGGAILVDGPSSPRDRLTTFGAPVPLHIQRGWEAGYYTSSDIEIVGTGHNCPVRLNGVAFLQRAVKAEINDKTVELITSNFVVAYAAKEFEFPCSLTDQSNAHRLYEQAKEDPDNLFPVTIELAGGDGETVEITTLPQLQAYLKAMHVHTRAARVSGWALKARAKAATTAGELEHIREDNEARS